MMCLNKYFQQKQQHTSKYTLRMYTHTVHTYTHIHAHTHVHTCVCTCVVYANARLRISIRKYECGLIGLLIVTWYTVSRAQ